MNLDHQYGNSYFFRSERERSGIVYTCDLGFIDLAHLRDLIDLTLFYYLYLTREGKNKRDSIFPTFGYKGHVRILNFIPSTDRLEMASSMAYDESVFHEIESYWRASLGNHHSAFSPEDLVSNALGTFVARRSITPSTVSDVDKFNRMATENIRFVLTNLRARDKSGTLDAFSKINNLWFKGEPFLIDYIQRRNFGGTIVKPRPWYVDNVPGCTPPPLPIDWLSPLLGGVQSYYLATYLRPRVGTKLSGFVPELPSVVSNRDFAFEIENIKTDASERYGERFDKPD